MTHDTQMHLLLLSELVFAQRAKDPETFKRWFAAGSRITTSTTLQREQLMHSQLVEENSKEHQESTGFEIHTSMTDTELSMRYQEDNFSSPNKSNLSRY
tara:strand:+ start:106 stop:402 length:297 start_codon:yes stop_codon:yes gene_type:complete